MGDVPVEEDCGVFGMLVQVVWNAPGSPFERVLNGGHLRFFLLQQHQIGHFLFCFCRRVGQPQGLLLPDEGDFLARLGPLPESSSILIGLIHDIRLTKKEITIGLFGCIGIGDVNYTNRDLLT